MHTIFLRTTLVLTVVCLAVPVGAQNREHQQLSAELRILQEQAQQALLTMAQLGEALKAINARMDASDQAAQKRFADQELLIKKLAAAVDAIGERTQDTDTRLRRLADEVEALRSAVTSLPALLSAPAATTSTEASPLDPNVPLPAVPPPGAQQASTVGLSPSRMLETARSDYFAGSYTTAIGGFEALLRTFPTSEAASEAQFLIGESHYNQKRYADAVIAYNATIQKYPRSMSVPEAYYKRGKAQEFLGQPDAARASYEQLIKAYPDTQNAGLARQALDRLGRQTAPPRP
jgi:tol-pal system protein YbgF